MKENNLWYQVNWCLRRRWPQPIMPPSTRSVPARTGWGGQTGAGLVWKPANTYRRLAKQFSRGTGASLLSFLSPGPRGGPLPAKGPACSTCATVHFPRQAMASTQAKCFCHTSIVLRLLSLLRFTPREATWSSLFP